MGIDYREKIVFGKNISPVKMTVQNVSDYPFHWHDYLEIIMVIKGNIRLYATTTSAQLNPGDVEILNFNEIHRIVGNPGNIVPRCILIHPRIFL